MIPSIGCKQQSALRKPCGHIRPAAGVDFHYRTYSGDELAQASPAGKEGFYLLRFNAGTGQLECDPAIKGEGQLRLKDRGSPRGRNRANMGSFGALHVAKRKHFAVSCGLAM